MEVTYIANEGFLLLHKGKKLLLDALWYKEDLTYCDVPDRETVEKLKYALEPFDNIDLITTSHRHIDHFDSQITVSHLKNNRKGVFISAKQVVDDIKHLTKEYDEVRKHIKKVDIENNSFCQINHQGILIKAIRFSHCPYYIRDTITGLKYNKHEAIENISFIFDIEGYRVFHSGDIDYTELSSLVNSELFSGYVDLALLDSGFLYCDEAIDFINQYLNPKTIVLMHIDPQYLDELKEISKHKCDVLPKIVIFERCLEKRVML